MWWHGSVGRAHRSHRLGRGAERRQWRMKRGGSVVSKGGIPPPQGGIATIANLTEQAKRSETVGSSPTVTTTEQPLKIKGCDFFVPRHHCRWVHFFRVHLGDVDGSCHHSVHTVVWLSCRKIGVARLVESLLRRASQMRCSGDALNLKLPCFRVIVLLSYTPTSHCRKDHPQPRIPHLQTRIPLFPVLLPMPHFHGRPVHN